MPKRLPFRAIAHGRTSYFPFHGPDAVKAFHTAKAGDLLGAGKYCTILDERDLAGKAATQSMANLWQGERLPPGSVLYVFDETGYGDFMQFLRYLKPIRERLGRYVRVVMFCRKETIELARPLARKWMIELEPFHNANGRWGEIDVRHSDVVLGSTSLVRCPFVFGMEGMEQPYIVADPALSERWRVEMDTVVGEGVFKVGVCYEAAQEITKGKTFSAAENRICPVEHFQRLCDAFKGRIAFFLLMPRKEEAPPRIEGIADMGVYLRNWQDTAAALSVMDLTITVDTALCNLAGAMGKPVWTLVPHSSCWRWGTDPVSTAWYPSMKLYRHPKVGDWKGAMDRVIQDLETLYTSRNSEE